MSEEQRTKLFLDQMIYEKTMDSLSRDMPYEERIKIGTKALRFVAEMAIKLADEKEKRTVYIEK